MTGHSDNRSGNGGSGELKEGACKSKGESMDVRSARTLPPDLMDQTAGSCVNLAADNPWRLPVPKTSKAKFETIDKTDPLALFGNQFGIQRTRPLTIWLYSTWYYWTH